MISNNTKFYKFRTCNEYSFNDLEGKRIYFSSLFDQNDPFEGKNNISNILKGVKDETQNSLKHRYIYSLVFDEMGDQNVVCNNLPMWTHYAAQHKGFCIEYNKEILSGFEEMNDSNIAVNGKIWTSIDYTPLRKDEALMYTDRYKDIAEILKHKHSSSIGENEARLIRHITDDRKEEQSMEIASNSIIAVYLGCRMPLKDKLKLINICTMINVPCFQMSISNDRYALEPNEIDLKIIDPDTCQVKIKEKCQTK